MDLKPSEIISSLADDDRKLLNGILGIEKRRLHIQEIKANQRNEKEIVSEIIAVINEVVNDDN